MPRLVESLSRFVGRVELYARGLDGERRAAEEALARGRPLEARERARAILAEIPGSLLGLALWADAAEEAWLDHEAIEALSELAERLPWRGDVWLRLGRAALRLGRPEARDALARAAASPEDRDAARAALLTLCDVDLAAGDAARALRWLERVAPSMGPDPEVALRRAECELALGEPERAREAAAGIGDEPAEPGRASLVFARLALLGAEHAGPAELPAAADHALRAYLLDATGGAEVLAAVVAASRDAVLVDRVRRVVAAKGELEAPSWAAAFAFSEGRRDDARRALVRGLGAGDPGAVAGLLRLATETRDLDSLHAIAERDPGLLPADLRRLREAAVLQAGGDDLAALEGLDRVGGDGAAWAAELRRALVASWVPAGSGAERARWGRVLPALRELASALARLDLVRSIEALAVEGQRPLRVAVVGEFNAGKSTFLNALLGVDVAPTGVLPTTATLHWVAWAPDPFARVVVRGAPDRVVPHAALKPTLRALDAAGAKVERVFIYAPIERLKRVEVLDTPGFNAPDPEHVAAARQAFDEAHVAIWLLDATAPLKESERRVLDEIRALGVPVQILVNKADRLPPGGLERVLEHVREGLAASGLATHAPPIAFSARLSLAGRLGDAVALEASGWSAVEALLSEGIVDRSDALRERALRRKAGRIAAELAETAASRAAADRAASRAAVERAAALRAAAARLRREREAVAASVTRAIEPARALLAADLRPLAEVYDEHGRQDRGVRAYVAERFVARLSDVVANALGQAVGVAPPERAVAAVAACLQGAVSAVDDPAGLAARPLESVLEAAAAAFASSLSALAQEAPPSAPSALLAQRAEALHEALGRPTATGP